MTEIQNMDVKKDPTLRATSSNRDEVPHLFLLLGAGVTPAEGSVKPTAGFTLNKVIPLRLSRDFRSRRDCAKRTVWR
jgi:hypothetical protein